MSNSAPLLTADELEHMPQCEHGYELVEGRLVRVSPVSYEHARIVMAFGAMLRAHAKRDALGDVLTELGCKLASNPDTVRAPDISFIRRERLQQRPRGFWHGPPDLVVEVLSPEDRPGEVRSKVDEYLRRGVLAVLVVDANEQSVIVHRRLAPPLHLHADDELLLDDVVPGFSCRAGEMFE